MPSFRFLCFLWTLLPAIALADICSRSPEIRRALVQQATQYRAELTGTADGLNCHQVDEEHLANIEKLFLNNIRHLRDGDLAGLSGLKILSIRNSGLTALPREFAQLTALRELHLPHNRLGPNMPESLHELANLEALDLSHNHLESALAWHLTGILTLKKLRLLNLSHNQIGSYIPRLLFIRFSNLQLLDLSHNRLEGVLPNFLAEMKGLTWANFAHNDLTGPIPGNLDELENLQGLLLNNNRLVGPVPTNLATHPNLQWLDISNNRFYSPLPQEFVDNLEKFRELKSFPASQLRPLFALEMRLRWLKSNWWKCWIGDTLYDFHARFLEIKEYPKNNANCSN